MGEEAPTKHSAHDGAGGAAALNDKESSGTSRASAAGGEDAHQGHDQSNEVDSDADSSSAPIAKRPKVLLLVRSRREPTSEEEEEELSRRWTCQTIRSKIQTFLAKKTMTQTEFLKTIGANSNSFQRFMKLKGPFGGNQNSTYWGSLKFFDRLEKKTKEEKAAAKASGAKSKTAKRKAGDDDSDESPAAKKKKFQTRLEQIEAVELPADLKVYDDCDVVRANIQDFFLTKVMAQTAFAAHLNVSIAALRKYLARKGKREGVGIVYEAAYRFFEKVRILDNAPKTNKRKKVEMERPEGYSLVRDPTHCWVHVSEINPKVRW